MKPPLSFAPFVVQGVTPLGGLAQKCAKIPTPNLSDRRLQEVFPERLAVFVAAEDGHGSDRQFAG